MLGQSGGIGKVRIGQPAQVLIAECGLPCTPSRAPSCALLPSSARHPAAGDRQTD
jgi:hypothetical protein